MKYALSFAAGGLLVAGSVWLAGGLPAGMFIAGGFTALALSVAGVWSLGLSRFVRFVSAFASAFQGITPESPRAATPGPRKTANVVSFQKQKVMLSTVQQEVLSALCNLGMKLAEAQTLVLDASAGKPGLDFDTLFRRCMRPASASSSRSAMASA